MDEMNNHIPEQDNQDLENQEITTPENTNESEPTVENTVVNSPALKKPFSKKLIIGGLIAIVVIGIIAAVGFWALIKPPVVSTTTTTQKPPETDLGFLDILDEYGYTADQIGEMSEILENVGITSVKNLEVEEISADTRIARGVCTKAEAIELMSARSSEEVVYVEFEIYKGIIIRVTVIAEVGDAGLDGLNEQGVSLYDNDKGGYLNKVDWENEIIEDYPAQDEQEHKHTKAVMPAVAPSCTETGLTEGKYCSICGKTLDAQEVVPVVAHTYDDKYDAKCNVCGYERDAECAHAESEVIPGKEATCTATGLTDGTKCKKCGEILTAQTSIPVKDHKYTSAVTEPTCSEKGYTTHTCSVCGDSYKDTYTDTVAHTMGDWYVHTAPTFYEKGEERKSCANCDHYESREIATVGSEYTDPAIIVQNVTVNQGAEEVVLEVYIKNNPGIIAMTLQMNVDDNAFALQSAKKGDTLPSTDLTVGKQTSSPYRFLFDAMEVTEEDKKDGVLLTITLNVKDPNALAKGEYNVTFSYTDGDIYDENFNTIDLQMVSGTITVK